MYTLHRPTPANDNADDTRPTQKIYVLDRRERETLPAPSCCLGTYFHSSWCHLNDSSLLATRKEGAR